MSFPLAADPPVSPTIPIVPAFDENPPVSPTIPSEPVSAEQFAFIASVPKGRFFLDLCSGKTKPLSAAVQHLQLSCLPIDILHSFNHDLLLNPVQECLLRVCASGQVSYTGAAPESGEFSLLELHEPGPKPIRTSEFPHGLPNLDATQLQRLAKSRALLERSVQCLLATYAAGGHGHLEQPKGALSWHNDLVLNWVTTCAPFLILVAACRYGLDSADSWLFASSYQPCVSLAALCNHNTPHVSLINKRLSDGSFLSRQSAEYPQSLAQQFALAIALLLSVGSELTLSQANTAIPIKSHTEPPHSNVDGAGALSKPDWSAPQSSQDPLKALRQAWTQHILKHELHHRLQQRLAVTSSAPPFDEAIISQFRSILDSLSPTPMDWSVPAEQPFCLHALHALSHWIQDADVNLFPSLLEGVPTGFQRDIPSSHVFAPSSNEPPLDPQLSSHFSNWKSAEDHPEITAELLEEEVSQGWVQKYDGDIDQARLTWPTGVALGKLGVAFSSTRPPRLIVDPSISGTNQACHIPEKQCFPSVKDVISSFPLRDCGQPQSGFTLDIKSAHKCVRLRPSEQGLMGFSFRNQLFFYRVCPFGARCSQHWWGRLGGFLLRVFHLLIYLKHSMWLFVDDYLLTAPEDVTPLFATLIVIMCQVFCVPVSWKKTVLHCCQTWIGWNFNFHAGLLQLHPDKQRKLLDMIRDLLHQSRTKRRHLERFLGTVIWATAPFATMRSLLHWLYADLARPPATQYSCDPQDWLSLQNCLSDSMVFETRPAGTSIPVGSKLLAARHVAITTRADLAKVPITERRVWLRVADPNSHSRKLSIESKNTLRTFESWLKFGVPQISMRPSPSWPGIAKADAFAAGAECGIGGFIQFPNGSIQWFSERFCQSDFHQLSIPLATDLQRNIDFLETLAQLALLHLVTEHQSHVRFPFRIVTHSDNTTAEATGNSLFSTKMPLALVLERLSFFCSRKAIRLEVQHIAGASNDLADFLSRWNGSDDLPSDILKSNRLRLPLSQLWALHPVATVYPDSGTVPWIHLIA